MKNKVLAIVVVFLFVAGLLVFNYPVIGTLYNQLHQGTVMAEYDETLAQMEQEEMDRLWKEADDYNKKIVKTGPTIVDAFTAEDKDADPEYDQILNMEESGVMGSVEIPCINVYLPIYHGTSSEVLNVGSGHLKGSSFPIGGESTHAVLTGHRGLPSAELFTNLDQVKVGDVFYIYILKKTLAYKVYDIETVLPEDVASLSIQEGKDLVTLVTCTPYGINSHRLLIHGERTEYNAEDVSQKQASAETLWHWLLTQKTFLVSVGLLLLMIIYGIISLIKKIKSNSHREKGEANL